MIARRLFLEISSQGGCNEAEAYDVAHGLIAMLYWAVFLSDKETKEAIAKQVRTYLEFCKEACKINDATNSELFVYVFLTTLLCILIPTIISLIPNYQVSNQLLHSSKIRNLWYYMLGEPLSDESIPEEAPPIPTYLPTWNDVPELRDTLEKLPQFLSVQAQFGTLMAAYLALKASLETRAKLRYTSEPDSEDENVCTIVDTQPVHNLATTLLASISEELGCMSGIMNAFDICTSIVLVGLDQLTANNDLESINSVCHKLHHYNINFATAIAISKDLFADELPKAFNRHCPGEMSELFNLLDPISVIPALKGFPNQLRKQTTAAISIDPLPVIQLYVSLFMSQNRGKKRSRGKRRSQSRALKHQRADDDVGSDQSATTTGPANEDHSHPLQRLEFWLPNGHHIAIAHNVLHISEEHYLDLSVTCESPRTLPRRMGRWPRSLPSTPDAAGQATNSCYVASNGSSDHNVGTSDTSSEENEKEE
jgi:hypothetical protein